MKPRIYIDNSVIGGYYDEDFEQETKQFFQRIEKKDFYVYFSEVNEAELSLAPEHVRKLKNKIPTECYRFIELDEEARQLGNAYIEEKILGQASLNDAYHIAIASVNRLDVLVSWNFRHIVNYNKIILFNSVNLKLGYPTIDIRTPREMLKYDD